MFDFSSISIKPRGPMASSYTSRAADPNKLPRTSSKDGEKISHFLSGFALGHLDPAGDLSPLQILVSYSLDENKTIN